MCRKVVIDVEMCRVKSCGGRFPLKNEIIQIGAVMMDDSYQVVDEFSTYVRPEFGKVDHFITELTGITERNTRKAPSFAEAVSSLNSWAGSEDVEFYAWSDSDYYQIRNEARRKIADTESLVRILDKHQWVDYQQIVSSRFNTGKVLALSEALELAEVDAEGRMHDGLDDARNTAGLIAKLELNPEFTPVVKKLNVAEMLDHEPLSTSLSSLFQGLDIAM